MTYSVFSLEYHTEHPLSWFPTQDVMLHVQCICTVPVAKTTENVYTTQCCNIKYSTLQHSLPLVRITYLHIHTNIPLLTGEIPHVY